jgi:gamma-glutamylcyclotransferase (GGCT)/AIG2-like uncharacterized protein YtfP
MIETALLVYGTLRHDEPEHRRFCRGMYAWQSARLRGRMFRTTAGYRLLVVPKHSVLFHATGDAAADEQRRAAITTIALAEALDAASADGSEWVDGELLRFRDASVAWPPLDAWEGFSPDTETAYPRCVVPAQVGQTLLPVWAYVANSAPMGAVPL